MPTLYLHIGLPKTGTTAIQAFCLENIDALAAKGYCFPQVPREYGSIPAHNARFMTREVVREDGSFATPEEEANWRKGIEYVAEQFHNYPNVILTDEAVWRVKSSGLWRNLKAASEKYGFQVKIIVYLRRQDLYISSFWAEKVKTYPESLHYGVETQKFENSIERMEEWSTPDYYKHVETIAEFFGRDAIVVRIYDRSRFVEGDVVPDFLDAIGLTMDSSFSPLNHEKNQSLGGNMLEIKRVLNKIFERDPTMYNFFRELAEKGFAMDSEQAPASLYSDAERDAILKRYEESNRLLARDYFGDEGAQLFPPPKPQLPKWTPDNPQMYESIILFFGMIAHRQQKEIEELKSRLYLRKKLRRLRVVLPMKLKSLWKKPKDK